MSRNTHLILVLAALGPSLFSMDSSRPVPAPAQPKGIACWADFDGDGLEDLLRTDATGALVFWRNQGDGTFLASTENAGLAGLTGFTTAVATDFDRDGRCDLLLGGPGMPSRLLHGAARGMFSDATAESCLDAVCGVLAAEERDYDRDGWVDLWIEQVQESLLLRNHGGCFEVALSQPRAAAFESGRSVDNGKPSTGVPGRSVSGLDAIAPTGSSALAGAASTTTSSPPHLPRTPTTLCAGSLSDASNPGACIEASSVPSIGRLFPLSPDWFFDTNGVLNVGTSIAMPGIGDLGQGTEDLGVDDIYFDGGPDSLSRLMLSNDGSNDMLRIEDPGYGTIMSFHNGGSVGISTNSPATKLHVDSGDASSHNLIRVSSTAPHGLVAGVQLEKSGVGWTIGTGANDFGGEGALGIRSYAEVTAMVINGNGNVGIGITNAPTARLDVNGETATNTLRIRGGSDVVEEFEADDSIEPGTVVVAGELAEGRIEASTVAYDRRVVGVISGAGGVRPGIRLGQEQTLEGDKLVAMIGRVYVKCSAESGAIRPGDRLTTASLRGHAMKATDREQSDGAVIGKALGTLNDGSGLVLVLVNLQ